MQCARCQAENPPESRFCGACGSMLSAVTCETCGRQVVPDQRFCRACGAPVAAVAAEPMPSREVRSEAERRQLTVMFCDLVESTTLSERLDPEELRELVRAYQRVCAEVVQKFEGQVAQYLGDGVLVYFGYPEAHEDDAQRAIRTALGIVDAVRALNTSSQSRDGVRLAVRVGVHTGVVVVGEIGGPGKREHLALGETPNLAARLQTLAQPDSVLISAATHRLVAGFFITRDVGPQTLKGVSAPLHVFQVTGESSARSRLDVVDPVGFTPLVGREEEVALLLHRWRQATEGQGQVVVLTGEPGIGKSRLVQVVKEQVADQRHRRLECRCSPYYVHTPLYPLIDLLPRAFDLNREETSEAKLAKLEQGLAETDIALGDTMPLLASLLSLPPTDRYPLAPMSPERQKQKTLESLLALLLMMTNEDPLLLIVEDLHWVDHTTLEWLALLLDQVPTTRLMVLLTTRPSFAAPWSARSHLSCLTLTRFAQRHTETMVTRVAGGKTLPAEILYQIVTKTDGVPLFVEELTKMVLESGLLRETAGRYELARPLAPLAIPTTLRDSLMARLDRLASVKDVAQLAATLGRAFPYRLIRAVSLLDEPTLQRALGRLVEAELLYQRGVPPDGTYIFKHALIQDAAYQSLLRTTRQQYHQRIARALVEQFQVETEAKPEFVAHHYTEAGLSQEAIAYWQRAGRRALGRSANVEAIEHFVRGLDLLNTLPPSDDRDRLELGVQEGLVPALIAARGHAARETARAVTRTRELSERVGDPAEVFPMLFGVWVVHLVGGDFRTAREHAEHSLRLAEAKQDEALLVFAHMMVGDSYYWLGDLTVSRMHFERSLSLYDLPAHGPLAVRYGFDAKTVCLHYLALVLWALGYADRASQAMQESLEAATEAGHTFSIAHAMGMGLYLRAFRREPEAARQLAASLSAFSSEQGFPLWTALALFCRGWARHAERGADEGLAEMHEGEAGARATGTTIARSLRLALLVESYARAGLIEDGLRAVDEALAYIERHGERPHEAELHRLKGELLLKQNARGEGPAEACFHAAIEIARRQEAKLLELRATTSLARLWQRQGKRDHARLMLAAVYDWFTEGFGTADLKDAESLLDELS